MVDHKYCTLSDSQCIRYGALQNISHQLVSFSLGISAVLVKSCRLVVHVRPDFSLH